MEILLLVIYLVGSILSGAITNMYVDKTGGFRRTEDYFMVFLAFPLMSWVGFAMTACYMCLMKELNNE